METKERETVDKGGLLYYFLSSFHTPFPNLLYYYLYFPRMPYICEYLALLLCGILPPKLTSPYLLIFQDLAKRTSEQLFFLY